MRLSKLENLGRSFQVNRISVQCLAKLCVLVKNSINRMLSQRKIRTEYAYGYITLVDAKDRK